MHGRCVILYLVVNIKGGLGHIMIMLGVMAVRKIAKDCEWS